MLNVAPEAVVIPKFADPLIQPVSARPSPSTSMIGLLVASAGTPDPAAAHPLATGAAVGAAGGPPWWSELSWS